MGSLNAALSIAVGALGADTGEIDAANNNIANANTPGYSRQIAVLKEAPPLNTGYFTVGEGVDLTGYQSVRDQLVQSQIQLETQAQGSANAQLTTLQQLQPTFTTSTQDIGTELSAFFSSLSSLSTNASSTTDRQAVLSAAQNLANAFNSTSSAITSQTAGLNTQVDQDVARINQLTQQIAALNPQINAAKAGGQDGGALVDQQNQLILKLSGLTNLAVTQTADGPTLTTANGTALVVGSQSFALTTTENSNGNQQVLDANGADVTAQISSGDLGGTLQTRDKTLTGLLNSLDILANQFGAAVNTAQAEGYDGNGAVGATLFTLPASVAGSAAQISVATADPSKIAASSNGSSGSNGNIVNLVAVQNNELPLGQTPTAAYANIVYQVGQLADNASAESSASSSSLQQLNDQLSSVSGVSIDEESTNLITYQTAYEAAARVVSTVQSLFSVTMLMGTAAAE